MIRVNNYEKKRLVEYLKSGMNVLILFNDHGMGDCVMFLPLYKKLKELYPSVNFNLKCNIGQEFFNEINCKEYDYEFYIKFPEWNMRPFFPSCMNLSKPAICASYELGIPFTKYDEFTWKPNEIKNSGIVIPKNSIGIAYQVTSNPNKSIDYNPAKFVWGIVKEYGFNPVEVHFEHKLGKSQNKKYDFIDFTCRNYEANIENVIDVINKCKGFIGVNTGTFCMATSMKDGNTLHMFKRYHFAPHYKMCNPVKEIDCRTVSSISIKILKKYLDGLK